jgi:hypothetical protein
MLEQVPWGVECDSERFLWFIVFRVYCAFVWLFRVVVDALLYLHPELWG